MKLLSLTQGKFAKVDDEDFDWLSQFKWRLGKHDLRNGKVVNYYAHRTIYLGINPNSKGKTRKGRRKQQVITLGKFILGIENNRELRADYVDGDNLNCQKSNLRIASVSQINMGSTSTSNPDDKTSKYIGVSKKYDARRKQSFWRVSMTPAKGKKLIEHLFPFTDKGEIKAAKKYNKLAKKHHGEFAKLNQII